MYPIGPDSYKMTGMFAEVFDNLQVCTTECITDNKKSELNILTRYGAKNFRVGAPKPWNVTVKISGVKGQQEPRYGCFL